MRKCMFALLGACLAGVVSLTTAAVNEAPAKADLSPEMLQLERRAQGGDVAAQAELGAAYSLGNGVDKDFGQARQWLSRAADKGNAIAQSLLAYLYRDGLGVERDYVTAARWFEQAAKQGHANAQTNLALLYKEGRGVCCVFFLVVLWFVLVVFLGVVFVVVFLGLLHEEGVDGKPDYAAAARWYTQAAEHNHALSQKKLAHLYEMGHGVAQDNVKAYTWYAIAGVWDGDGETLTPGDPRLTLSTKMTPEQIEQANQAATAWWENHFKQDSGAP